MMDRTEARKLALGYAVQSVAFAGADDLLVVARAYEAYLLGDEEGVAVDAQDAINDTLHTKMEPRGQQPVDFSDQVMKPRLEDMTEGEAIDAVYKYWQRVVNADIRR
jgi:hypothetical protein